MKRFRHALWATVGVALFLSMNLLLTFAPAHSTLPPTGETTPAPHSKIPTFSSFKQSLELAFEPGSAEFNTLVEADRLFLEGNTQAAEQLYRQVKGQFSQPQGDQAIAQPITDPEQLSGAGRVYWREAQAGFEQKLESRIFVPLQQLVERHPEFIPGHVLLVQALQDYGRGEEALAVLERATTLYPNEPELIKAEITALQTEEKWLESSIAARQFAVLYPEHPQAADFKAIADDDLGRYRSGIRRRLIGQTLVTGALSIGDLLLTGNVAGTIPALQLTILLMQGEASFGNQLAESFQKQLPMVDDPAIVTYVNEVGQKMAKLMGRDEFEYEFFVVKDKNLNAFALPGGKVFVNTGALQKINSEAELAGLLGHEVAHAVLSHGYQRVVQSALLSNLNRVVPMGDLIAALVGRAYSRQNERQADVLGSRVLANSNYAADGLRNLMQTFTELDGGGPRVLSWLSSHPASSDRLRYLEELIQRNGYNRYAFEGVERHAQIQSRVEELFPEEEAGNAVELFLAGA
ncbi:M48 family metalloprotease [Laspinema sp. A4]|uniref:M48 family metallopeptidase n=1 Tax=Laspinema sp. D2d TaxID=2953686 RepID=UPI0021BB42E0|nr:M48 family metallopeptidase [Laspinema sp. D2d]MCT7982114.1 M48 family metalloprotease [Laspinema sp. D2d]